MDDREAVWEAVWEALPARWHLGPPTFDPGRHVYSVTARSGSRGRGDPPVTVTWTGETEVDALRDLDDRLRGVPRPDGGRMDELGRRARLRFIDGAEEWTRENVGRPMTAPELERVIDRAP